MNDDEIRRWEATEARYQRRIDRQKRIIGRNERIRLAVKDYLAEDDDITPTQYDTILDIWEKTK